jgi:hypothetical protein
MPKPFRLRVANVNLKRAGYDYSSRQHDHGLLHQMLSSLDDAPHVLFLSECTFYGERVFLSEPYFDALEVMDNLWGESRDEEGRTFPAAQYTGFLSKVDGSINSPGLFVDRRYVRPSKHYPPDWRKVLANSLVTEINGCEILLKCVHWSGSGGYTGFAQASSQDGQLAQLAAIIAGDFNATSSAAGEIVPADWRLLCDGQGNSYKLSQKGKREPDGTWRLFTDAIDGFLDHGWWDVGAQAKDFTPTVHPVIDGGSGLRIDRIMVSDRAPVTLVPGSYKVHVPEPGTEVSDHRMVSCTFEIDAPGGEA